MRHRVRIDEIPASGLVYRVDEGTPALREGLSEAAGQAGEHRCTARIQLHREDGRIAIDGTLTVDLKLSCARCLAPVTFRDERDIRAALLLDAPPGEEEVELRGPDLEESYLEGDEIDLLELVREQVILAVPDKPLCDEDCLGLCPHCGADRNREPCSCGGADPDPRLAVLANFVPDDGTPSH